MAAAVDWRSASCGVLGDVVTGRFGVEVDGPPTLKAIREAAGIDGTWSRGTIRGLQARVYENYRWPRTSDLRC